MERVSMRGTDNAVAVVGLSCRLPGARDHHEFAANLSAGVSSISQITPDRWDPAEFYSPDVTAPGRSVSKWCGMVDEPHGFDHPFFRVSPREARLMDPQQRLLLQESWNCVEDSGTDLSRIQRARTSVHVGVMGRDHLQFATDPGVPVESHSALGGYDCLLANRVSHVLGLRGASVSVDAACASSLVAVHLASQALMCEETDFALAGGVSLNLHPWKYVSFSKARMLSPGGLCRTFDKNADGYVPGDGVAMLLLRRLDDAERDGDHIYGVIRGSAVNHGGRRLTVTAPTVSSQVEVITAALERAGVDPRTVGYVEAHGTGTSLGDPVEVEALRRVFAAASPDTGWCRIGSAKPNIGHLEAAAGAAGLIKVLTMMRDRVIPPSVHVSVPNPLIDFERSPFRLALAREDWSPEDPEAPLRAGVSSFGMGGVNSHLVVEEYVPSHARSPRRSEDEGEFAAHPFLLSAHSDTSLRGLLDRWRGVLSRGEPFPGSVSDVCATLARGRSHSGHRLGGVVRDLDDIARLVRDTELPSGPVSEAGWWLRVGRLAVPADPVLGTFLNAPGPREILDTLAAGADGLGETVERLRAGQQGPGEECLFSYLVLRCVLDHGLRPTAVSASGPGLWPGLAAVESLEPADAVRLAMGGFAAEAEPLPPSLPFVDPTTGNPLVTTGPDGDRLRSLLSDVAPDAAEHAMLIGKGVSLIDTQYTFRGNLREWNGILRTHGRSDWVVPLDGDGLREAGSRTGERSLFVALAVHNALDRLNRKWDLPRERMLTEPRLGEVLDLLLDGLLTAEDLVVLLEGEGAEPVAERAAERLRLFREEHPGSLAARGRSRGDMGSVLEWRNKAEAGVVADPPPGVAVVSVGDCPGTVDEGVAHVEIGGEDSVADLLVRPLTALWLSGAPIDWDARYLGQAFQKTPLPTRVFDLHHHRLGSPARLATTSEGRTNGQGPVAANGGVTEVEGYWEETARSPVPSGPGESVLVVVPADHDRGDMARAVRAFAPLRLHWIRRGTSFSEDPDGWTVRPEEREDWSRVLGSSHISGTSGNTVVVLGAGRGEGLAHTTTGEALTLFPLLQTLAAAREPARVVHVDRAVNTVPGPTSSAVAGLSRSLRRENTMVGLTAVAVEGPLRGEGFWRRLADEAGRDDGDLVVRWGDRRLLRRHRVSVPGTGGTRPERAAFGTGTYLVAGGGGGLGVLVARHLLRDPGARVVLLGRSPRPSQGVADLIAAQPAPDTRLTYLSADITDLDDLSGAVDRARSLHGAITGVIHAAGVLRDGFLPAKKAQDVHEVLAPKLSGAVNLDIVTQDDPVEAFVLFSSVVAAIGNPGQTDYGYANAFLEGFAAQRRVDGVRPGRTVVIDWPLWAEGGMGVGENAVSVFGASTGLTPMPTATGLALLDRSLSTGDDHHTFFHGEGVDALALLAPHHPRVRLPTAERPADEDAVLAASRSYCASVISELLAVPERDVDHDAGLDQYGLDSILITQFSSRLESDLGVVAHTLLFECRTLGQAAARIAPQAPAALLDWAGGSDPSARDGKATSERPEDGVRRSPLTAVVPGPERRDAVTEDAVAIIGMAGRYPDADDLDAFWDNLLHGRDAVTEIPRERWDYRRHYAPEAADEGGMYCKWGAFLRDVDHFDPLFFGISPREAEVMDPQERLFLQTAWRTFEDAGYPPFRLGSPDDVQARSVGVFVGVTTQSYLLWGPDHRRQGGTAVPNSMPWSIANRVSYWLDLHGPSMPVDTACASSLSALHLACESLNRGECRMALVGGVNLYLHPSKYEWLCQMQMLSRSGHCHAFGSDADGFVPGEGVGGVLLKPLREAEADGDRVLGVIRGTAVNHGGRTNGFTVPNPLAQAELVDTALERAGLEPGDIDYVEAHGTGTALGDPIEITGLGQVFGGGGPRPDIAIGSVKSNIGHLESAAGIAGLTKLLLQMRNRVLVPSLHAEHDNPRIDFAGTPFRLQREADAWAERPVREPSGERVPRRAGISSFGAGGANAHVIVEEYMGGVLPRGAAGGEHLVVVSARDTDRLRAWCAVLADTLRGAVDVPRLSEIAYQLQIRREPLQQRVAVLVGSVDELVDRLAAEARGNPRPDNRWATARRSVSGSRSDVERALMERDFPELAAHWVAGAHIPWSELYPGPLRHVELPGYPFAEERYVLPLPPEGAEGLSWTEGGVSESSHPFVERFEDGEGSARFTGSEFFLDDHRVDGVPIFPAVGYLEMVAAAVRATGRRVRSLRGNVWDSPIIVEEPRRVHVAFTERTDGVSYEIFSRAPGGEDRLHGRGRVDTGAPDDGAAPDPVDLDATRARCPDEASARNFYSRVHDRGLQLGRSYQGASRLHFGEGEALTEIRLPEHLVTGFKDFDLHPSVLDSALQGSLGLIDRRDPAAGLHLPFTIGAVDVFGTLTRHCFAHVVLRASTENGSKFDVRVTDEAGTVLVVVRDFWLRPWRAPQSVSAAPGTFFAPVWNREPIPVASGPQEQALTLFLAPSLDAGRLLVSAWRDGAPGAGTCVVAVPGEDHRTRGPGEFEVRPHELDDFTSLVSALPAAARCDVVVLWPQTAFTGRGPEIGGQFDDGLVPLLHLTRALLSAGDRIPTRFLCAFPGGPGNTQPGYEALGGLLRTARRESRRLSHRLVEIPAPDVAALATGDPARVLTLLRSELGAAWEGDQHVRYREGERRVRRWERHLPSGKKPSPLRNGGVYVITGGVGGLGASVALHLASAVSARLLLTGRSAADARVADLLDRVRTAGGEALYVSADASEADGADLAVRAARDAYGAVHGVFHCAGVLRDGYLAHEEPTRVAEVFAPKAWGALHLDHATRDDPLDLFVLFSSIASALGNPGQAGYAYANAFLDSFAEWRQERRERGTRSGMTLSLNWPLWAEGGMGVDEQVREYLRDRLGLVPLETSVGLSAMDDMLTRAPGQVLFVPGDGAKVAGHLEIDTHATILEDTVPDPGPVVATVSPSPPVAGTPGDGHALRALLVAEVADVAKLDPARVDPGADIGDYGFDSLSFSRLANQVNRRLGVDLTPAAFFEYTSADAVAEHLAEAFPDEVASFCAPPTDTRSPVTEPEPPVPAIPRLQAPVVPRPATSATSAAARPPSTRREPIAIVGMHGVLPGSRDLDEYWGHLDAGHDLVTEIPSDRWDWREYFGDPLREPGTTNSKWGGFLREVDRFDARFFGISPREADLMDPQQRLFLETSYKAIEEAGYKPSDLARGRTGLFVGVATHDYYELLREAGVPVEAYTTTGMFHAILANRVSYLLNLTGPSFPIDTACSSSLVAVRSAVEAIWSGSCDTAIAGGVNLLLAPMIYISFARAGMLSPDGRCKAFDESANGYVRGEGAGALLLKPLSRAIRDGDHVHAVIRGSAVNHGGRVNTLTTPNPNAQSELLVRAFEEGGVDPGTVGYMEVHGTGTALGDPIEINGLKRAFGELRDRAGLPRLTEPGTLVGSVKSNIGHLEAAAGMAGIFKVILSMKHGRIPGNLHIDNVNPQIKLEGSPLRLATSTQPWPRPRAEGGGEAPRRAGVSSFGFGGVNGHVLLEEYVEREPAPTAAVGRPHVLILSARTPERLAEYAGLLAEAARSGGTPRATRFGREEAEELVVAEIAALLGVRSTDVHGDDTLEELGVVAGRLVRLRDRLRDVLDLPSALAHVAPGHSVADVVADVGATTAARSGPQDPDSAWLRDAAYTLQTGREPMEHRLAVVASTPSELADRLSRFARTSETGAGVHAARAEPTPGQDTLTEGDPDRLASHWVSGGKVDWESLHRGEHRQRLSLPTYPFARTRHWIPATGEPRRPGSESPAVETRTGPREGEETTSVWIDAGTPVVDQHRVRGRVLLPGVAHLELARTALTKALTEPFELERVVWSAPCEVEPPGHELSVRVVTSGSRTSFEISDSREGSRVVYARGSARTADREAVSARPLSVEEARARCSTTVTHDTVYRCFARLGIDYGPYFRALEEVRVGRGEAIARLRATESAADGDKFALYAPVMDAALQAVTAMEFTYGEVPSTTRLPFSVESVRVLRPLSTAEHVHVRVLAEGGYDVSVLDARGRPCALLNEVVVREAKDELSGLLFAPHWRERPLPEPSTAPEPEPGDHLVVYLDGALGLPEEITRRQDGGRVWNLRLADRNRRLSERTWEVDDRHPGGLEDALGEMLGIRHVWFLGGLAPRIPATGTDPSVDEHAGRTAGSLFRLVKALAKTDHIQHLRTLRVAVNGVQDVGGRRVDNPSAGGLVGFSKSFAKEFPHIDTACVDLGAVVGEDATSSRFTALVDALSREPAQRDGEEVAFVMGRRYVKALAPITLPPRPGSPFRKYGRYLIIGGAGGIGSTLARHLARSVSARVVLVGRRVQDGETDGEIAAVEALGGQASYLRADVSDPGQLASALVEARAILGGLDGVVHAAMVLSDGIIERLGEADFDAVMAPKAAGSMALARLLVDEPLDFLLFMSSVQSFTGSAGQSNYAAASAAQDSVAQWLAGRAGYPVRVVNWGFWGTVGHVASPEYRERLGAQGYGSIGTAEGMAVVERVISGDERQVVAVRAEDRVLASIGVDTSEGHGTATVPGAHFTPLAADVNAEQRVLDEFVHQDALEALRAVGLFRDHTRGHLRSELVRDSGAVSKYGPLLDALSTALVRHGYLVEERGRLLLSRVPPVRAATSPHQLTVEHPNLSARIALVTACLSALPQVLRGDLAATEVLFPAGSMDLVSRIYRDEELVDYCNSVVADRVRAHVLRRLRDPQGTGSVRILEIGAGTGSTTRGVLAALTGVHGVSYDFTDVSERFLRQAEQELTPNGVDLGFRSLDIDLPIVDQGLVAGHYDVVVAANSIHASKDLDAALGRVRSLLADDGELVLTEVTRVLAFHKVTFGLLDGWWHHIDGDRRLPGSPLLDVEMWRRRLERAGFTRAVALGTGRAPGELSQRVIAAGAAATTTPARGPSPRREEEVPRPALSDPAPETGHTPPADLPQLVSGIVRDLVADCLGMDREEVDGGTPLASIGVDSIVGVELINRINHDLGVVLKTIVIFDHPTVDALTAFLVDRHGTTLADRLTPASTGSGTRAEHAPGGTGNPQSATVPGGAFPFPAVEEPTGPKTPDIGSAAGTPPAFAGFRAVRFERPGHPQGLRIRPIEPVAPGPGEIEVQVRAFPVNFSDFLLAKGLYPLMPDFPFTPGVEVSGVVRRVGPDVRRLAVGDEVIALTRPEMGGQASVVVTDANFAVRKPSNVSHEEACGFPVAFLAMYLALERAGIREGERVLIEAATGTNGLIAVQLARLAGAEVIATAGSTAKVDFLTGLGVVDPVDHNRFDIAEQVMRRTGGRGVDVVVNTQAGGALQRGLNLLAPEGRYVEIAVFGLQASGGVDLSRLVDNQSFHSFNTKKFFLQHPEQRIPYLQIMADHLESGRVRPTVAHALPFDRVTDAYALKEDRATVGRVVVTVPEPAPGSGSRSAEPASDILIASGAEPGSHGGGGDIAVIGVSGRFPGAPDIDSLWSNLEHGVSSVRSVPRERWDSERYFDPDPTRRDTTYCGRGGFLEDIDLFDAPFFDISGKEAEQTDPQQRLFLQEAWRALEDAGYPSASLGGTSCGVFVGAGPSEYLTRMNKAEATKEAQAFWGNEASVLAARISYFLNLRGPSLAVNTACSSSLVALHLAVRSLHSGECGVAIAGGVFLTLAPDYFVVASNGNMLSPEGVCKTFDDSANGFGPGEGVGALVLKPLDRALADGDHVHGVIKGTAINQDGRTNGITAPSGLAQTEVELAAYARAGIDPDTIGYVEAHGTGTRLGDPVEVEALSNAFRESTDRTGFCAIGSVKTNIGHAAAAAGIAGVIKVLLSFRHRRIPASLNFERANRHIDFANTPFYVNTRLREWPVDGPTPRRAAVSGFGFSGTNAHVVLEEGPPARRRVPDCGPVSVIPVSAKTPTALRARIKDLLAWLDTGGADASPQEIAYSLQNGRDHFRERAVFLATTREELSGQLREALSDSGAPSGPDGTGGQPSAPASSAEAYLRGEEVDWSALWTGPSGTRLPLPTYPFDGHRYWYTDEDTVYAGAEPGARDVLDTRIVTAPVGEHRLELTLTGNEPFLRDHVVQGRRVLPGVLTLELVRRAADSAGVRADAIRDMAWAHPVAFDSGLVTVAVSLTPGRSGTRFEVRAEGVTADPVTHASGTLNLSDTDTPEVVDLAELRRRCPRAVDPADHYRDMRHHGLVHGPSLTSLREVSTGEGEAVAKVELPETGGEALSGFVLHPALLDGALQALSALGDPATGLALPFTVREVAWHRALPARCHVHVTMRHATRHLSHYDVRVLDEQGAVLVTLTDLSTRRPGTTTEPRPTGTDEALRALLRRLEDGEIGETEAQAAMEAILEQ